LPLFLSGICGGKRGRETQDIVENINQQTDLPPLLKGGGPLAVEGFYITKGKGL
jgi:hypothetical protein